MPSITALFEGYPHIPKAWGTEIVLTNNDHYCAKLLCIEEGMQCSLHRHGVKCETFWVLEGRVVIRHGSDPAWLHSEAKDPGDGVYLPAGTWHLFHSTAGGAVMLEVSMPHSDLDVERLSPSGPIEIF